MNVCAKLRYAPLRIKKALGIFRELITTTTTITTRVAFWDPPSGSKKQSPVEVFRGVLDISTVKLQAEAAAMCFVDQVYLCYVHN